MNTKYPLSIILLLVFIAIGCSDKIGITGTVKFDDGEPLNLGSVCFRNEKTTYMGYLDKKGQYRIGESKDGDGIHPGVYQVWIAGTDEGTVKLLPDGRAAGFGSVIRVHPQFTSPRSDGLSFEVKKGGPKTFDITVKRP